MSPPDPKIPEQKSPLPQIPVGNISARQAPQLAYGRQAPLGAGAPQRSLGASLMGAGMQNPQDRQRMAGMMLGR